MNKINEKKSSNKVVAGALALGVLATGTFAWSDMKQHKTNTAMGGGVDHNVSLVDVFDPEGADDWKVGGDLEKEVRIMNTGKEGEGSVYVAVTLSEYMEIGDAPKDIWTEERFMIDSDGKHIKSDSQDSLKSLVEAQGFEFREDDVKEVTVKLLSGEEETMFYHMTKDGDANGIYGKHVRIDREGSEGLKNAKPVIEGTVKANTKDHHGDVVDESNYPLINFNKKDESPIREYVELPVAKEGTVFDNGGDIINDSANEEGRWILSGNIAFWSKPLAPGESTTNLVDGLRLIKDPEGIFHYDLHVNLITADTANNEVFSDLYGHDIAKAVWESQINDTDSPGDSDYEPDEEADEEPPEEDD